MCWSLSGRVHLSSTTISVPISVHLSWKPNGGIGGQTDANPSSNDTFTYHAVYQFILNPFARSSDAQSLGYSKNYFPIPTYFFQINLLFRWGSHRNSLKVIPSQIITKQKKKKKYHEFQLHFCTGYERNNIVHTMTMKCFKFLTLFPRFFSFIFISLHHFLLKFFDWKMRQVY